MHEVLICLMSMKKTHIFFLILVLGILFRLPFIMVSPYQVDYDNCTIGLMARHILQGDFPVFFYGQPYMGSIEAFVIAFGFLLFGQSGYTLLFSVLIFYILFVVSIYYLGSLIGTRRTGLYAILYLSFGPCYFLIHTYSPRGGYIETLFFGTLLLVISIRITDRIEMGMSRKGLYLLLGFISGLAFWTHFLIMYYLPAIALFLGILELRRLKIGTFIGNITLSGIAFIIGSLPFWIYNLKNGFPSLTFKGAVGERIGLTTVWKKLVFSDLWSLLGIECVNARWFNYIILVTYGAVFLIFFLGAFYYKDSRNKFVLLFLFILSTISIYTTNRFALLHTHKYLLPVFSFIPICIGYGCTILDSRKKFLGLFVIAVIMSFNITGSVQSLKKWAPEIRQDEAEFKGLLEFCLSNNIDRIITPLWDSYRISFFSREKIICEKVRDERLLEYAAIVEKSDSPGIFSGPGSSIPDSLDSIGCTYKEVNFGKYSVWYDISVPNYYGRNILPADWTARSNYGTDLAGFSFDRNIDFTWTSLAPKKDDMWFLLDVGKVYKIFKIVIYNGDHIHNYPSSYRVEISIDGKEWDVIQDGRDKEPIFVSGPRVYWHYVYGRWEDIFNPREARYIRLTLLDNSEVHPWEINEVFVYEYIGTKEINCETALSELADFLRKNSILFVYTDFWPSASIKECDIQTLNPFLDRYPKQIYTKRNVVLNKNVAFVVNTDEMFGIEDILSSYNIPYKKEIISHYIVYYFDSLPKEFEYMPGLVWAGETVLKGNFKDRSWYLYKLGEGFVKERELDKAIRCFKDAIDCYRNNIRAYYSLAELNDEGMQDFYLREYKLRTEPKIKGGARFGKDIEFLGFSIDRDAYSPGDTITIDYYWRIERAIQGDLFVYAHFIRDKEIIFQNDHPFLEIYPRHLSPFKGEIFWERYKVVIPKVCEQGDYLIRLGIWDMEKRYKVLKSEFPSGSDYITIGKIKIRL